MKAYNLYVTLFALVLLFASCEKEPIDHVDYTEDVTTSVLVRSSIDLPTTIDELREAGIGVSNRIENIVNNDLVTLLEAAALAADPSKENRRALRQQGFKKNQIRNALPRINRQYLELVEELQNQANDNGGTDNGGTDAGQGTDTDQGTGPLPTPGTDPSLTVEQQAFVDRFSIPQDVLDELIARNSLDNIIAREQTQLSNPANLVVLGNDLFEISVGIVTRTRAQMEGTFSFQYLFSSFFDTRLQTPNTAETFDRIGREVFQALIDSL